MSINKYANVKIKKDKKSNPLFIRWQKEPFSTFLRKLKDEKQISKKIPKHESKYDLRCISLKKTRLSDAVLSNSCLDSICAYNAHLTKCDIDRCIIHDGDFEEADMIDINFSHSEFTTSIFKKSSFSNILMSESSFIDCNFSGAKFRKINVNNAVFDNSNFCFLENPEEIKITGNPRSVKDAIIDRYTLLMLSDSEFKKELCINGNIIHNYKFSKQYDVALSFAGEQRDYVEKVAKYLTESGVRVFYDNYETHVLWGKELISHLTELYSQKCTYVIIFASQDYAAKGWTNVERVAVLSRILSGEYDSILPVQMDDTIIKGLTNGKGYVDGRHKTPKVISDTFIKRMVEDLKN